MADSPGPRPPIVHRRWPRLALLLAMPIVSIGIVVLAFELVLRVPGLESLTDLDPTLEAGPLVYQPKQTVPHRLGREINTVIRINSRGFKDDEFQPSASDRTVVALGDSFTEGWGVDGDKTWVSVLGRTLGTGPHGYAHVYNGGRNGTNPKNYAEVYKEFFAGDKSVQLVLMGFCLLNDVIEPGTPARRRARELSPADRVQLAVSRYSLLYNLVRRRLRYNETLNAWLGTAGFGNAPEMAMEFRNTEANRSRWPYTAQFIIDFASLVRSQGRQFAVVLIPTKEHADDEYFKRLEALTRSSDADVVRDGVRNYLRDAFEAAGVKVLDLTEEFKARNRNPAPLYFEGDSHWNAAGHQLAGDAIARYLRTEGLAANLGSATE